MATDYTQDANCQGAWLFNGSGTNDAVDSSQNSNDLHSVNGASQGSGFTDLVSASLQYWQRDDSGGEICTGLDGFSDFSLYIKFDADNVSGSKSLITKFHGGTSWSYRARLESGGSEIMIRISADGSVTGDFVRDAPTFNTGTEYLLAMTFDDTNNVGRIYRNGAELSVDTDGYVITVFDSDAEFKIGMDDGNWFDGKIYEVAVFDKVLSEAEGLDITTNGLVPAADVVLFRRRRM